MSRDHRKLRVFHDAHSLTLAIYKHTRTISTLATFPRTSGSASARKFVAQRSRSPAISLKEMRARTRDYLKFLYIALGSACELKYLVGLSDELGYSGSASSNIQERCNAVVKQLERLTQTMEVEAAAQKEKSDRTVVRSRSPKSEVYAIAFVAAMNVARGSKPIDS